jgi:hypothetical protein
MMDFDRLYHLLTKYEDDGVFNQYRDVHSELDRPGGAHIRRRNLGQYLAAFADARFVLVGEAAGYAGCRFSGIPFTCEAQLVGAEPLAWTSGLALDRSSRAKTPWAERSATMVWETLGERRDVLLWNAFPWHPYGGRGPLSNRHPGRDLGAGQEVLRCLLALFPGARPYAIGRVAERALSELDVAAPYIRHPSRGGKAKFVVGATTLLAK